MSALLLGLLLSQASTWDTAFPPDAVRSYLEGDAPSVLIAAAGTPNEDLSAAATAFERSARAGKGVKLVMNAVSLGDLSTASDADIVKTAQVMPVDMVAVVRVFPGQTAPMAVVSFVLKNGKTVSAFSIERGKVLLAREGGGVTGGVSESTMSSFRDETKRAQNEGKKAEQAADALDEQHIGYGEGVVANAQTGQVISGFIRPYLGKKYPKPIDELQVYEIAGRTDLVDALKTKRTAGYAMLIGGGVALVAGFVVVLAPFLGQCRTYSGTPSNPGLCKDRYDVNAFLIGGSIAGAGGLAMAMSWLFFMPGGPDKLIPVINDHNRKIDEEMKKRDLRVSFSPIPGGAAASVSGTF